MDGWERRILDGIGLIPEIVVRYRPGYPSTLLEWLHREIRPGTSA